MSAPEPAGVDADAGTQDTARTLQTPTRGARTSNTRTSDIRASDTRTSDTRALGAGGQGSRTSGILSRPYRFLSLGIVSVVVMIAFEATAVGTAMPVVARDLDGVSLYAFAFSAYFTTSLFGMVSAGEWADRRGPLAPLSAGIGAFVVGLVVAGTAGSMWVFIVGRAVQGLGGGLVIVALYVVVGRAYPERLRPSLMVGFAAGWVVPSIVGPLLSGTVTEQLGWRWVFLGIPVLVVLPMALALPHIRRRAQGPAGGAPADASADEYEYEYADRDSDPVPTADLTAEPDSAPAQDPHPHPAPTGTAPTPTNPPDDTTTAGTPTVKPGTPTETADPPPATLTPTDPSLGTHPSAPPPAASSAPATRAAAPAGTVARRSRIRQALAVSLGAGLLQYAAQDPLAWRSLLPFAAGVALLVPALLRLMPRGTYRAARGLPSVVLLRGLAAGSFISAESFVPLMLVTQRGLSPTLAGLSLALGGATWAVGSYIQARPRVQPYRERLVMAGMVIVALAIAVLSSALLDAVPVWIVAVAWGFGCFGMGLAISATSVLLLKLSPPREAGANSAALQISDALSNVVLLAAGGAAFAALGGGSVAHGATTAAAHGSHPAAFLVVFLPMAGVALVGVWVATRLRSASGA